MGNIKQLSAVVATGISIGWMIGMSASPVISGVISTVLALSAGAVLVISGFRFKDFELTVPNAQATLGYLAVFSFLLAVTSSVAVNYRLNLVRKEIKQNVLFWNDMFLLGKVPVGSSFHQQIVSAMFEAQYGTDSTKTASTKSGNTSNYIGLLSNHLDELPQLKNQAGILANRLHNNQNLDADFQNSYPDFLLELYSDSSMSKDSRIYILENLQTISEH